MLEDLMCYGQYLNFSESRKEPMNYCKKVNSTFVIVSDQLWNVKCIQENSNVYWKNDRNQCYNSNKISGKEDTMERVHPRNIKKVILEILVLGLNMESGAKGFVTQLMVCDEDRIHATPKIWYSRYSSKQIQEGHSSLSLTFSSEKGHKTSRGYALTVSYLFLPKQVIRHVFKKYSP